VVLFGDFVRFFFSESIRFNWWFCSALIGRTAFSRFFISYLFLGGFVSVFLSANTLSFSLEKTLELVIGK
jgi:hypothetical protein